MIQRLALLRRTFEGCGEDHSRCLPLPSTSSAFLPSSTMTSNGENTPLQPRELNTNHERDNSLIRRSWHAMSEVFSPFSPSALASLPKKTFRRRPRYTRADNVPEAEQDEQGQMPSIRDYHSINTVPPQVRVPKKIATPIKVEGKVWFANERSASPILSLKLMDAHHTLQHGSRT